MKTRLRVARSDDLSTCNAFVTAALSAFTASFENNGPAFRDFTHREVQKPPFLTIPVKSILEEEEEKGNERSLRKRESNRFFHLFLLVGNYIV